MPDPAAVSPPSAAPVHGVIGSRGSAPLNTRIAFLVELARRLHQYGTSSPRLEQAISRAAQRLGLVADVWSSPTAIIISFAELAQGEDGIAQVTQVIRLAPGDVNLGRLCEADAVAPGDCRRAGQHGFRVSLLRCPLLRY